jgi:hypothetical protein
MNLYDELMALVTALEKAHVEYALCGGVALAFHGHPRFTKDIDLLVRAEDLQKVREAVAACGFKIEGGRVPLRLGKPDEQIIHRVSKIQGHDVLTLDLMIVNPGLEEIWRSRGVFDWKGLRVRVVSRDGLVKMKRLAGRTQDLADVERLGSPEGESGQHGDDDGAVDKSR